MTAAIGFVLDNEEEDEAEEVADDNVCTGCAEFTPVEAPAPTLPEIVRAAKAMRKVGATKFEWGDFKVSFK